MGSKLGLIAGNGDFPKLFVLRAQELGHELSVVGLRDFCSLELASLADNFISLPIGQISRACDFLRFCDVSSVTFLGGTPRAEIAAKSKLDLLGAYFLLRSLFRGDDSMLRLISRHFASKGFELLGAHEILTNSLLSESIVGEVSGVTLSALEQRAWDASAELGSADRGQAVVVGADGLLFEDQRGTNELLARARGIAGEKVFAKRSKPGQDLRLDMPAFGLRTLQLIKEAGIESVLLEKGKVLILEPESIRSFAEKEGIRILALEGPV